MGVEFALASQCESAINPIHEAVVQHKMVSLDAEDTMRLIEDFGLYVGDKTESVYYALRTSLAG